MIPEKIEEVRARFIADLEEQIWKKECNAAFDESRIPLIRDEREKAIDEVVKLAKEGKSVEDKAFVEKDNTKETRMKIKKLKNDINKANELADNCEATMAAIANSVKTARMEADGLKKRIEFAKTYGNETNKN
jgi:chromosome segregation ATPase